MKLPSLDLLAQSFTTTIKRFPLALGVALVGTFSALMLTEIGSHTETENMFRNLFMTASLGLPLFFALHIFCEGASIRKLNEIILYIVGIGMLVFYYWSLPGDTFETQDVTYRYAVLNVSAHLLVAFSAFYVYAEVNGFWQFNKLLFLRFLTAALYSSVLYLGLAGALLAIDKLFSVKVDGTVYLDLWIIIAGLFNTTFFLGGIASPVTSLRDETSYPKGLKIFTQYVLIPLVTVYLLILYAYLLKISLAWTLPKGWVANLILGFSVSGTLSLLLVWPIREQEGNDWIKAFSRFYYLSLVPLIVLLFIAIGKRISDYGVTLERYIVIMLGVWLAVITLYFLFSKKKNIILIPLTLFLFLVCSAFGPWGMFSMSERSQLGRLKEVLSRNGAFVNGKIKKLSTEESAMIKWEDAEEVGSILRYLENNHSLKVVSALFTDSCNAMDGSDVHSYDLENCIGIMSNGVYPADTTAYVNTLSFYSEDNREDAGITTTGYDKLYKINPYQTDTEGDYASLIGNRLSMMADSQQKIHIQLDPIVNQLSILPPEANYQPQERMTFIVQSEDGKEVKIKLIDISMSKDGGKYKINSFNGYVLTKN